MMPKADLKSNVSELVRLWAASNKTWTEEELLLYPLTSLVAEFGGDLRLFLGFSFMAIWHEVRECCCKYDGIDVNTIFPEESDNTDKF